MSDEDESFGEALNSIEQTLYESMSLAEPDSVLDSFSIWRILAGSLVPTLWLIAVVGIPFLFVGLLGGWANEFRYGDASAFICVALIAAFAEKMVELASESIGRKPGTVSSREERIVNRLIVGVGSAYLIGFFIWNLAFVLVAHNRVSHPKVDWVQVLAFVLAAGYLPLVRGLVAPNIRELYLETVRDEFPAARGAKKGRFKG